MSSQTRRYLFIVGAPRSGTTWVHQMLAEHPEVAAIPQEMTLLSKYLAPAARAFADEAEHIRRGDWKQGLPLVMEPQEFNAGLLRIVDEVYGRIHALKPGATLVIDKHPHYAAHLPFITKLLPACKVIHVLRDGRDVAVSTMRTKRLIGHGQGSIEGAAEMWVNRVQQAQRFGEQVGPERYLEVRYEDLLQETHQGLERILAFADIPNDTEYLARVTQEFDMNRRTVSGGDASLNAMRNKPGAIWSSKLMLHERYLMECIAGTTLTKQGYATKDWWVLRWSDRPRIWWWLLRTRWGMVRKALAEAWHYPDTTHEP